MRDTCGGEGYERCALQRPDDGVSLNAAGQAFSAVVVANAIAPLLGARWEAIYRKVAPVAPAN